MEQKMPFWYTEEQRTARGDTLRGLYAEGGAGMRTRQRKFTIEKAQNPKMTFGLTVGGLFCAVLLLYGLVWRKRK